LPTWRRASMIRNERAVPLSHCLGSPVPRKVAPWSCSIFHIL
jgi:hypothetical protein